MDTYSAGLIVATRRAWACLLGAGWKPRSAGRGAW